MTVLLIMLLAFHALFMTFMYCIVIIIDFSLLFDINLCFVAKFGYILILGCRNVAGGVVRLLDTKVSCCFGGKKQLCMYVSYVRLFSVVVVGL